MALTPKTKPLRSQKDVLDFLAKKKIDTSKLCLLAVRGYYRDSMGVKGKNDRSLYDDAVFVVSPNVFASYNFNVDPNGYRIGTGTGAKKGMANLKEGTWKYQKGLHKGYQAFTQAAEVTVIRDGVPPYEDTGFFFINIHKGGYNSTSSLGCQTVPYEQWDAFKNLIYGELNRLSQKTFQYVLVHESETGWNK